MMRRGLCAAWTRCVLSIALATGVLAGWAPHASAQGASLQGIVTDDETGSPLESSVVQLEGAGRDYSSRTDRNGYYQFEGIEPDSYTLRIEHLGYSPYAEPLTLRPGQASTVSVRMQLQPVALDEVVVGGQAASGAVRRELGRQRVASSDIARIPVPAASGDLVSYLQTLPGVVTTGDRGGQLFVRGGSHTENLTLVDGLPIYQPFHILGFFSAFPEELVANADFYAGGFGPQYSGRTSSVLDVRMRDGSRREYRSSGSVSPFLAEAVIEGPASGREGNWSFLASARRSLIEETSPSVLGEPHPLGFESQFGKLSFLNDDNARCSAMAMRTEDQGRMDPEDHVSRVGWENVVYGGRCVVPHDWSHRLIDANIGVSIVRNVAVSREASSFSSDTKRFQLQVNTTDLAWGIPYEAGASVSLDEMEYNVFDLFTAQGGSEHLWVYKTFIEAEFDLGERVLLKPGAVLHLSQPTRGLEPRLRASWRPWGSESEEVNATIGLYRQAIAGLSDTRDAAAVFVAWTPVPEGVSTEALHAILGWQQSFGTRLSWSLEGYYKRLRNIAVPVWNTVVEFDTDLALARGETFGADVRVEYDQAPFYGFAGYGWTLTEYEAAQDHFNIWFGEPVQRYHPPHDRRHQVNALIALDLGAFRASAGWQYGSGRPYTRPLGFDEAFDFRYGLDDVVANPGVQRVILEKPYLGRLPAVHRLDVSLAGTVGLPFGELEIQAGAINVYDRANIFFYDLYTRRRLDQLPIAPYLSLRLVVP